jgi:hypothetical protein
MTGATPDCTSRMLLKWNSAAGLCDPNPNSALFAGGWTPMPLKLGHLPSRRPERLTPAQQMVELSRERMERRVDRRCFIYVKRRFTVFRGCAPNGDLLDLRRCFAFDL